MTVIYVILSIMLLGVIVLVHELGHFAVGRLCGIGVEEFSIGFGPRLLGWKRGGIQYSLRGVPLGGYVRFTGEDEDSDQENAFNHHPVWKRILTVAAGASMNFVLAFVAILLLYCFYFYDYDQVPAFSSVEQGSSAEEAGLLAGDRVISVDGVQLSDDQEGFDTMYELFSARTDETPFELVILRDGEEIAVEVSKREDENGQWLMGVTLGELRRIDFLTALRCSGETFANMSTMMLDVLKNLIFRGEGVDQVSGTVGVIGEVSKSISQGFDMALNLAAVISMNLGVMNLLPFPALDGGRLVFLLIEAIRRKPVPPEKEGMVHAAGMIALLCLMVVLTYSDIMKMIGA